MIAYMKNRFISLCIVQIWIIIAFASYAVKLSEYKKLYQDVKEFTPISATCVNSDRSYSRSGRHRRTRYKNTYQYVVDNQEYRVTYWNESSRGTSRILFYNPMNPDICSKYQNYEEASSKNGIIIIFALFGQAIIIFFVVKALYKPKEEPIGNVGVVISDDLDFITEEPTKQSSNDSILTSTENERGVETIPFRLKGQMQEEENADEIEMVAYTTSTKPMEGFVLYTEEEYKKMNR